MSAVTMTGGYAPVQYRSEPLRAVGSADGEGAVVRTRLRLTSRGRFVFTTLAAIPLIVWAFVLVLGAGGAAADVAGGGAALEYVTVDVGASLWEIAEAVAPSADPRDTIAEIVRINGLDGATIVPGQQLAIPASQ
ncbi:LysM peptidoglycan-binding domain-containing protein [Agromyces sp. NPDC058136]|uniref:LysM peptidoglycan-binding domain-containing protein n=1 Tax=Agromyces sp. NPDC058136 TaxID=3346354 RepID=UPI0036DC5FFC